MTFKDLQKLVQSQSGPEQKQLLLRLWDKPFWIWDPKQHKQEDIKTKGDCCFNHIIGLPRKDGIEKSIFDYEKLLYDSLQIPEFYNSSKHNFKEKHLWVKKATGLGVTEFMLRLMAWLCLRNDDYRNSQMCIVTGPNQDIAIKLIKRMKGLFEHKLGITFANKETVLELNGCSIEAYTSNHLDAYRALDNPKFILLYEADFFRKSEQEDVRHVSERYIAKSDPFIVMVSTPYAPDGLFDSIEKEPEESCIYKRILLDYTYGLDKIYTREEIEKAKVSPSFERGCWSLCVSDRIIFGPNRCLLSSCDSRRGDAYHQSFHIDAECNESQAKELRLYCWNTGSIWQHIPINSGIHGLWLQEEAGTASKGGSHLNVRSQSDIVFGFGWHLFMAYYQFSAKVSGCTGEPESRTAGIRRGGSRGCTSTERISKCGKIQLCKSSDNIRRGELS